MGILNKKVLLFVFLMIFSTGNRPLQAQLSPGKLHRSHAGLEGLENCTHCHVVRGKLSAQKCLACHQLLARQITDKRGLHALPEYRECQKCHVEHQGRNSALIYWKDGKERLDHRKTGFALVGAHAGLQCRQCHTAKNIQNKEVLTSREKDLNHTFLGLSPKCLSCHIDEHRGQMSESCLKCHNQSAWKPAPKFEHNKTRYPLNGKHQTVACRKCHKAKQDRPTGTDTTYLAFKIQRYSRCLNCHQDYHRGQLGRRCERCHTTAGWRHYDKQAFNHNMTPFPLRGRHVSLPCNSCHKNPLSLKIVRFKRCRDCHRDYHQGQFTSGASGGRCENCHTVDGFSPARFGLADHDKTAYPLKGAHRAVPCIACHKNTKTAKTQATGQFRFTSTRCVRCHTNPHGGQVDAYLNTVSSKSKMNGCEHCHNVNGWDEVDFDHSRTGFALLGRHKQVSCSGCHKKERRGDILFKDTPQRCAACHNDVHRGQFKKANGKTDCQRCHTSENWLPGKFNHNRDARFKLTGAHTKVPCNKCHATETENGRIFRRFKPLKDTCQACHGNRSFKKKETL